MCLNLELKQIECALTRNANDVYVTVDHGHILIVHNLISSYRTPLCVSVIDTGTLVHGSWFFTVVSEPVVVKSRLQL